MSRALFLYEDGEGVRSRVEHLEEGRLTDGDVLVSVLYSGVNYKDALAVTGRGKIIRGDYPFIPGIDLVGRVEESTSEKFRPGELVIATGWGLGETHWGGYSEVQRLRSEWLVPLPANLAPEGAMIAGTAGLTAMLSVMALEEAGIEPSDGAVDRPSHDAVDRSSHDTVDGPSHGAIDSSKFSHGEAAAFEPSGSPDAGSERSYGAEAGSVPSYGAEAGSVPSYGAEAGSEPSYGPDAGSEPSYGPDAGSEPTYGPEAGSEPTYGPEGGTKPSSGAEDASYRVRGEVVVTGASGGVGSMAVALLAGAGYTPVASTGSSGAHDYLRGLGAVRIIDRDELGRGPARPLDSARWAGAVDTVGGSTLAAILSQLDRHGSVAACGLAGGHDLNTTVFPFILRGVNLLGIDSNTCPMERRRRAWARIASTLSDDILQTIKADLIGLSEIPAYSERVLAGEIQGRLVVDVNR